MGIKDAVAIIAGSAAFKAAVNVMGAVSTGASVIGGTIQAVEAKNRGDTGRALSYAGKAGSTLASAGRKVVSKQRYANKRAAELKQPKTPRPKPKGQKSKIMTDVGKWNKLTKRISNLEDARDMLLSKPGQVNHAELNRINAIISKLRKEKSSLNKGHPKVISNRSYVEPDRD
jgi:hypothetical protein